MERNMSQIIFVIVLCFSLSLSQKYTSKFCQNNNLNCSLDDIDDINSSCQIMYPECKNFAFQNLNSTTLDDASINLYRDISYLHNGINITIFDANWTEINFRITRINHDFKFCRTIHKPLEEKTFYYDCDWPSTPKADYYLEYETLLKPHSQISTHKKFKFKMPETLPAPVLFSYINITEIPNISLHWNLYKINITVDNFLLKIYKSNEFIEEYNISSFNFYYNLKTYGNYTFKISIISQDLCSNCSEIPLPSIEYYKYKDSGFNLTTFIIYFIFTFVILLILILIILNYKTICPTNKSELEYSYPRTLLVYKSTDNLHNRLVESFAKLLKNDYSIKIILDIFDIPTSSHKDPFIWCKEVLKNVDFVIFITSPPGKEIGAYRKLYSLVLKLYEERYVFLKKIKFINVTFPYCNCSMIPDEINHLSTFLVNENVNKLIAFLKNNRSCFNSRLSSLLFLFESKIKKDSQYLEEYKKMLNQSKYHTWTIVENETFENDPILPNLKREIMPPKSEISPLRIKYGEHDYQINLDNIDLSGESQKIQEIDPLKNSKKNDLDYLPL